MQSNISGSLTAMRDGLISDLRTNSVNETIYALDKPRKELIVVDAEVASVAGMSGPITCRVTANVLELVQSSCRKRIRFL
jgi:hypothetical protein